MIDTFDELRIIAKDGCGLDANDRAVIARAADEMEHVYKLLLATQADLIASQGHRIALNDVLLDIKRAALPKFPSLSTGWQAVTFNGGIQCP